jgi:hypothetical protein
MTPMQIYNELVWKILLGSLINEGTTELLGQDRCKE